MAGKTVTQMAIDQTLDKFASKRDNFHEQMGDSLREELISFARTIETLEVGKEAKAKVFASLVETMRASLATKHDIDAFLGALDGVRGDAARGDFDGDLGDAFLGTFQGALDGHVASRGAATVDAEKQLKTLRKIGKNLGGNDADESDEDVCIDEAQDTGDAGLKDPIMQGLLVAPMVSKTCGHTYSASTVKDYFKGAGKKCAVYGCDKHLTAKDFKKDVAKEVKLKAYKKKQARAAQTQSRATQNVDMDEDSD